MNSSTIAITALTLGLMLQTGAHAQDTGVSEWSSAPCSSLALGPGPDLSHLQRIYLLGGTVFTVQYKYFADNACQLPLYSMVFKGRADAGAPVPAVADAYQVKVALERVLFTLDSPRGAAGAKACADGAFEVGVQRDVSAFACLHIAPKADCGVDYDIVRVKDGIVTPGFRSANMCTPQGAPTSLQSAGARYVETFR
jgi:hypothetical protein